MIKFLSSLKLAVINILVLAASAATGTVLESLYDLQTARYWVYQAFWFTMVLTSLGLNIFCVAMSRWPWKRRHTPFLAAHAGLLLLISGSWITQRFGIDGNLSVSEGEISNTVLFEEFRLLVKDSTRAFQFDVPWVPQQERFTPFSLSEYPIEVSQLIPHADFKIEFDADSDPSSSPAVYFQLSGGPMNISRSLWLWAGAGEWSKVSMGPALFVMHRDRGAEWINEPNSTMLQFRRTASDDLEYRTSSRKGGVKTGKIPLNTATGQFFDPGWMPGMKIEVKRWLPLARNNSHFEASRITSGMQAPPPAIELKAKNSNGSESSVWLGLDDQAQITLEGNSVVNVRFSRRNIQLPFSIYLNKFEIQNYPGTQSPRSYSSQVRVMDRNAPAQEVLISMNEPLHWQGITLYQSSFIPAEPRPITSVFSVNRDPGRWVKYLGSLLVVFGSILLFLVKYFRIKWFL